MMYWNDGWGVGSWLAMLVVMVVFWGGLAAVIVATVRSLGDRRDRGDNPQSILDRRFARGEIDEDEYEKRSAALRANTTIVG